MGAATSVAECASQYPSLKSIKCGTGSVAFGEFPSNPSITGVGVCLSLHSPSQNSAYTSASLDRHILRPNRRTLTPVLLPRPSHL